MSNATVISRRPIELSKLLRIALEGEVVLLLTQSVFASVIAHQPFWKTTWVLATVFMGPTVLTWPAVFDFSPITAAVAALYPISLVLVLVLASVVNRLKLTWAILAGTALGLAFYFVDLYGLVRWFPWLVQERSWITMASHLVFGGVAACLLKRIEEPTN